MILIYSCNHYTDIFSKTPQSSVSFLISGVVETNHSSGAETKCKDRYIYGSVC